MKTLKIGIVVQQFPFHSETFIVTKVLGLIEAGFDVQIFATEKSNFWDRFDILKNRQDVRSQIHVSVFKDRRNSVVFLLNAAGLVASKLLFSPKSFMWVVNSSRRDHRNYGLPFMSQLLYKLMFVGRKVDILHIEFDFQAYGLMDIKELLKCKVVLSGRGAVNRTSIPFKYPGFYDYVFRHVDAYHFISQYLFNEARKYGLKDTTPVFMVEPAIDSKLFADINRQPPKGNTVTLITTARLDWAKGYEFTLDAVALVHQQYPDIRYMILGQGFYQDAIKFAAYQNGLIDNGIVTFVGPVTREKVSQYLSEADIMIHGALEEGFCNAVIEGQAMRLPIVCSDAGGLPENIENGVTGFVVARRNAREMADKILELIHNPDLRCKMGVAGRERVLLRYSIQDQINKFVRMYNAI